MNVEMIKRALKYIIRGIPVQYVSVDIHVNNNPLRLQGKNILITGGAKGIGFAISKKCITEGAKVLICGRNENDLIKAQTELGENCKYLIFDVSDTKGMRKILDIAFESMDGCIDCLVNNAGISFHEKGFHEVTEEGFDSQFNVNFKGAYFLTKYFVEKIESQTGNTAANILFITSERGSYCSDIPYGLSKASINSLVGSLSNKLLQKSHIRVNGLAPGVTISNMTGRNSDSNMGYHGNHAGRVFMPEEMAEVASFLLSDYSACISGEIIHCDAGAHLKCI